MNHRHLLHGRNEKNKPGKFPSLCHVCRYDLFVFYNSRNIERDLAIT